jgi:hypothetical protein
MRAGEIGVDRTEGAAPCGSRLENRPRRRDVNRPLRTTRKQATALRDNQAAVRHERQIDGSASPVTIGVTDKRTPSLVRIVDAVSSAPTVAIAPGWGARREAAGCSTDRFGPRPIHRGRDIDRVKADGQRWQRRRCRRTGGDDRTQEPADNADGIAIDVRDVTERCDLYVIVGRLIPSETLVAADDDRDQPNSAFLRCGQQQRQQNQGLAHHTADYTDGRPCSA